MEDLVKLTEDLVLAIVSNKEAVKVNASEVDEQTIQIDVLVDEKDMPILIGRKGKVVNSIRTLLHASSYLHSKKNIKLNVFYNLYCQFDKKRLNLFGGLAQLARAPALHAGGQGFESLILHQKELYLNVWFKFLFA